MCGLFWPLEDRCKGQVVFCFVGTRYVSAKKIKSEDLVEFYLIFPSKQQNVQNMNHAASATHVQPCRLLLLHRS
jgi:hypothetical protein